MSHSRVFLCLFLGGLPLASGVQAQRPGARRPALERRFEERIGAVLRQRLGLTADQATRLREFGARAEPRRRALMTEDRQARSELRKALADSAPSQDRVAGLLDRSLKVQRERAQLLEEENRELATFLTPVQRARYFGLLEQLTRRMQEMRDQRDQGGFSRGDSGNRRRLLTRRPPGESPPGA